MKRRQGSLLFSLLWCLGLQAALADERTVQPAKDNTLYEDTTGSLSNGSGEALFVGRTNTGSVRRALLVFDLTSIPAGSVVQRATLSLTMTRTADPGAVTIGAHRVLQSWGESTSNATTQGGGGGAPAQPGDATWLHTFFDSQFWVNPGGDFAAASAIQSVGEEGEYAWTSEVLAADVQLWVDNQGVNFGWLMKADESSGVTAKAFGSRENSQPDRRPQLTVLYQPPEAGLFEFSVESYPVEEKSGRVSIRVNRTGGASGQVSVTVVSTDETAQAGEDYAAVGTLVTFSDGDSSDKLLDLEVLDDDTYEGEETFALSLTDPTGGAQLGERSLTRIVISDEDDLAHALHFAQFGNGGGFFSQIILLNLDVAREAHSRIVARSDEGFPLETTLNGVELQAGQLEVSIPARGSTALLTDSQGAVTVGSITVLSDRHLDGTVLFGGPFGLAGVGASRHPSSMLLGILETDLANGIDTGIAIQNLEKREIDLEFTLKSSAGAMLSSSRVEGLPPLGHLARFVTDLAWEPPVDFSRFEGSLVVEPSGSVAGTMIQTRPGQFATLPTVATTVLSAEPLKDSTLHEDAHGLLGNGSGSGVFVGRSGPDANEALRRGLLAFDLSQIPLNSEILDARLTMNLSRARDGEARSVTVHRLLKNWGEGQSVANGGEGADALPGDATWLHTFFDTELWDSPGGDFVASPSAAQIVGGRTQLGKYSWSSEGLAKDIQSWTRDPSTNFGWILRGDETANYTARRFASRETLDEADRPNLTAWYRLSRSEDAYFAQFGNGTGFFSQIVLLNEDEVAEASVSIMVRKDSGEPFEGTLSGEDLSNGQLVTRIPGGGITVLKTDATGQVEAGSVTVSSESPVSGVIIFGGSFGLAGVGSSRALSAGFVGPVETDLAGGTNTGIAVQNLVGEAVELQIELVGSDGTDLARGTLAVPANGHRALFVTDLTWDSPVNLVQFQGTVRVMGSTAMAATMIQTRPGQFATLPVSVLSGGAAE